MSAHPSIVIGASTGYVAGSNTVVLMCLYENKASLGYTSGMIKIQGSKHDMAANMCYQDLNPTDVDIQCAPTTAYNLKNLAIPYVSGYGIFYYGCIESFGCSAGDNCTNNTCTTWGSRISFDTGIPIRPTNNTAPPAPTGLTITPGSGTLTIGWNSANDPTGGEVFAYRIIIRDAGTAVISGYTEEGLRNVTIGSLTNGKAYSVEVYAISHNGIPSSAATGTGTPAGATNPTVYNILTIPDSPAAGASFTIKAQIANTGPSGKVRAVFKVGGTQISDQNSTLVTYPSGGLWEPTIAYMMPAATITITVEAYGWDGTNWILTDTKSITRTPSAVPCTGVTLTPFTASIKAGDKVTFTAAVTPSTTAFDVQFKDRAGTLLGTCKTSGGNCTFTWDSAGKPAGTYYVTASVAQGGCVSTESTITVSPAINQWNVNIYVRDSVTNAPVSGATVTIDTQSKQTDANGYVQFRVNEGTVSISTSKTGYNTYNDPAVLVFSDITKYYPIVVTGAATGSLIFVTVPTGAGIYFGTTLRGTTDPGTGVLTIPDIPVGRVDYTAKKTGYNDSTGFVTVAGGQATTVPVTLTVLIPGKGAVCVKSSPPGAKIYIDGADTGKVSAIPGAGCVSENIITDLDPAVTHAYKLTLSGYGDATGNVTIEAGKTTVLTVTLEKAGVPASTYLGISIAVIAALGIAYAATRK